MEKKLVVVPASWEILSDLDQEELPVGIEVCGRLCYKSEEKITENSSTGFCSKMVEHKHNSVLEMRVVTARVEVEDVQIFGDLIDIMPKYLIIDDITKYPSEKYTFLVTGSIRAFREMVLLYPDCLVTTSIASLLAAENPCFFEDIDSMVLIQTVNSIQLLSIQELDELQYENIEIFLRHRHIAVRFIVNRAVTHEIVRHRPCAFLQESQRYCRYSEDKFGNRVTFIKPIFYEEGSSEYAKWEQAMFLTEELYLDLLETSTPQAARTVLPNSCKTEIIVFTNLVEWNHIFHMRTSPVAEPSMREVMIPLQKEFKGMFVGDSFGKRFPEGYL